MNRWNSISEGMSRAFKARSRACPKCGRKQIQPKRRNWWQQSEGHKCRWCKAAARSVSPAGGTPEGPRP